MRQSGSDPVGQHLVSVYHVRVARTLACQAHPARPSRCEPSGQQPYSGTL